MSGIGVISNPLSGRNRRNPALAGRLGYILGEKGTLAQPEGLGPLESVAQHFKEREIDVVCINGGDGTVHTVLTKFIQAYGDTPLPRIALLRGGTMNTVAKNLGIKGSPEKILGSVIEQYHSEKPFSVVERNVMLVDGVQAGSLFGIGLASKYLEAYYEGGDASPWKAVKVLARAIASAITGGEFARWLAEPVPCSITIDGNTWAAPAWSVGLAGTVPDLGLGLRPFYAAERHLDHFHAIGYTCGAFGIARNLPAHWRAQAIVSDDVFDQVGKRMVIESNEPVSWMIDGDFHRGSQRIEVAAGPRIRWVVPDR